MTSARAVTTTPQWLLESQVGLCSCGGNGLRRKTGFVEKTITGSTGLVRAVLRSDDIAASNGLMQSIDERIKLVSIVLVLVAVSFVRHTSVLLAAYAFTLVFAHLSQIPLRFFVKRVWLFIPIFTGIVVLPATLNVITDGRVVVPLGSVFGHRVGITSQGLQAATLIVTRVALSISLVVLLTLTTAWSRLLAALRSLFVPRIFIVILGMAYRYIFQLLDVTDEMYVARKARTVKADRASASGRRFVAATAGSLFGKSNELAQEVHQAMVARGWRGNARTLGSRRISMRDVLWFVGCVLVALVVLAVDRSLGG